MSYIDQQLARYKTGPRGGVYYVESDGTRRYVDRGTIQRLEAARAVRRLVADDKEETRQPINGDENLPLAVVITAALVFTLHGVWALVARAEAAIGSTVQTFQPLEAFAWLAFFVIAGAAMWRKA